MVVMSVMMMVVVVVMSVMVLAVCLVAGAIKTCLCEHERGGLRGRKLQVAHPPKQRPAWEA